MAEIIGAICILQFSYTFPFMLKLTCDIQVDAMRGDHPYVAGGTLGNHSHRTDTWRQWSRWQRGLFTGNVVGKAFMFVMSAASLATAILGAYGSICAIIQTFKVAAATSFGCATP